ncbi:MAG: cytochrome c [Desulfuromonadaceae bacterium]|nr:cytochrome c [Desulfuromonadaceae bacterium]
MNRLPPKDVPAKKHSRSLAYAPLMLVMALFLQGCGDEKKLTPEQMALRQGKELYKKSCASCHGVRADGRGTRSGPSLLGPDFLYGGEQNALFHSIEQGRQNGMPAFSSTYSKTEITNIVNYLLFLQK